MQGSWISDDITFCIKGCEGCGVVRCERHPKNIHHPELPHSYSDFYETEYCPLQREKKMQDEMNDAMPTYEADPDDLVRVVRCKDCRFFAPSLCRKWSRYGTIMTKQNDFCSYGDRKDA